MLHRGTFFDYAIYFLWQASRLASQWIGRFLKEYYLTVLFVLMIPVMLARIDYNPRSVIWSDAEGYYQYLPALFIIKDVHKLPPGSVWPQYNEHGEYVDKYTCGIAIFEFPFFIAVYGFSYLAGIDTADYYNPLYCRSMALSGLFFAFLGLRILRKALLKIYSHSISAWVVISVFFGTNLFYYATKEMSVSHVYSFSLFCHLLYFLPAYLKNPSRNNSLLLGGILGWIVLIRPTNILLAVMLLLYDVYSMPELKTRINFYISHYRSLLWMFLASFIFFIPQLLYWKEMTGHWLYYSYTEEGFIYWNKPKITAVLFDVQNGLFLYSPLVLLMVAGIMLGLRKRSFHAPAILLIFSIATYIFASWWAWWFGGAFGHRCYVEYYALLAFPLAGLYQHIRLNWKKVFRVSFYSLVILLMIFSVRLSYLYTSLGGPWDGKDWRWAWEKYGWVLSNFFG
jgi:hypothetical protein